MTHWHCASSLFVLFGWETQPKFPCCWFKIRLGVFTEGVSGCSAWQTCVRCLFWFSAFSSKWRSETKTISFFFFFFPKHINREDLALTFFFFFLTYLSSKQRKTRKKALSCALAINWSCSLRSAARIRHMAGQKLCSHAFHSISPLPHY